MSEKTTEHDLERPLRDCLAILIAVLEEIGANPNTTNVGASVETSRGTEQIFSINAGEAIRSAQEALGRLEARS